MKTNAHLAFGPPAEFFQSKGVEPETKVGQPDGILHHNIGGIPHKISVPITFTPFASARHCSARCIFCSEALCHKNATTLSASLRPYADYFDGLSAVLRELIGIPLGISLSGLEATDDADWLCETVERLQQFEVLGGAVTDKVLYSNTSGLAEQTNGRRLIPRLQKYGLTRVEVSRHHFDAARNQAIMRFRDCDGVGRQNVFEKTLKDILANLHVKLVCVIQKTGIANLDDVENYLAWAQRMGVSEVVFREFSRTHDLYRENSTLRAIEDGRVSIESILQELDGTTDHHFELTGGTIGYYYWNARYLWKNALDVTFETSDYELMKTRHQSDVIYKLIYHANGNLTGDWDPNNCLLMKTSGGTDG
jgi:hypothetical protein